VLAYYNLTKQEIYSHVETVLGTVSADHACIIAR